MGISNVIGIVYGLQKIIRGVGEDRFVVAPLSCGWEGVDKPACNKTREEEMAKAPS